MTEITRKNLEKINKDELIEMAAGIKDKDNNGLVLDPEMLKNAMIDAILIRAEDVAEPPEEKKTPPAGDSLEEQLVEANARADAAENTAARATENLANSAGKKVGNVNKPEGEVIKRPDEVMTEDLATVGAKSNDELNESQRVAIEREIRRYVRRGYIMRSDKPVQLEKGYKDKISDADKSRANHFLKLLGRVDAKGDPILEWDESIVVPGFN